MQGIYRFIPLTLVIVFVLIIVAVLPAVGNSRKLRVENSSKEIEDRLQILEARIKHLKENRQLEVIYFMGSEANGFRGSKN